MLPSTDPRVMICVYRFLNMDATEVLQGVR
jgi:hypothetical protein